MRIKAKVKVGDRFRARVTRFTTYIYKGGPVHALRADAL